MRPGCWLPLGDNGHRCHMMYKQPVWGVSGRVLAAGATGCLWAPLSHPVPQDPMASSAGTAEPSARAEGPWLRKGRKRQAGGGGRGGKVRNSPVSTQVGEEDRGGRAAPGTRAGISLQPAERLLGEA